MTCPACTGTTRARSSPASSGWRPARRRCRRTRTDTRSAPRADATALALVLTRVREEDQSSYPALPAPARRPAMQRRPSLLALAALGLAPLAWHAGALAQGESLRAGFLTVRTGPLAAGGRQMEQGIQLLLKERGNMLAGRK